MSNENLDASKIVVQPGTAEDFIRKIKADAWDEGHQAGMDEGHGATIIKTNPYRTKGGA